MVTRVLKVLSRRIRGLHEAAYVLAVFALLSHLLALIRDRLFAHYFGASLTLDIYYAAFRIPDFIFVSVASMVSLFVLIPFLIDRLEKSHEDAHEFISSVFSGFFSLIVIVSAVVFIAAPILVRALLPGFTNSTAIQEVVMLTRIMLLSPILLGISNIFASITQTFHRFFVYAISPILYNVGIIVGVLFLYPLFGTSGLAWGVVLGALLHMAIQIPVVAREHLMPRFKIMLKGFGLSRLVAISLPRTIALAANQLVLLALIALASKMIEGSISVFTFGFNIQGVPLSIIAASYSVAAFPTLARFFSEGEHSRFFEHMLVAIRHIVFWSMPAMVLFVVLRAQIVRVALGSGAFSWEDTRLTAAVLAVFAVSLVAQGLEMLFIRGYYASGRTLRPLLVKIASSLFIMGVAYVGFMLFENSVFVRSFFENILRINGLAGTTVVILALAYTVGIIGSAITFWFLFRHDFGGHIPGSLYRTLIHSFSGSIVAGGAAYAGLVVFGTLLDLNTFVGIFTQGALAGILGILAGAVTLRGLRSDELEEVWSSLHNRFWRRSSVGIEPDEL